MKVDIKNQEVQEGFVFKKKYHEVTLQVEFSEEEKAIIKQNKLKDIILLKRDIPANRKVASYSSIMENDPTFWDLKVYSLLDKRGNSYAFHDLGSAKNYIADLKETLPKLKSMLENNVGEAEDESFEL